MSKIRCGVPGCNNNKRRNPEKHFFSCPSQVGKRELWIEAVWKSFEPNSWFSICEDHFDLRKDIEYFKVDGRPVLKKSVCPNRNLTQSEMALQAKIDKINWSCFVPTCGNKRLMTDKKVVFFSFPEGLQGQLWRSSVLEDEKTVNTSSVYELQFFCEEHFDIDMDIEKHFHSDCLVEYTVKVGILPSLNLGESKPIIGNETKKCLSDLHAHPRLILNNNINYLYASKLPAIIDMLRMEDDVPFVNMNDIKSEPVEMEERIDIKAEPMDTEYECEFNSDLFVIKEILDNNPLKLEPESISESEKESEHESESESSACKENSDDPDITTDDFSSSEDDSISSDDLSDPESLGSEKDSDVDMATRYECSLCKQFVKHLESHVQRVHWNFSKNVNSTICGLCLETFPSRKNLKNHQSVTHNGNAYSCDLCDCMTTKYADIHRHIIRVHSNERPFLCQHCALDYKFDWELKRHIQLKHMEVRERSHPCQNCEKKFFTSLAVRLHIDRVHLKLRPYHCKVDGCGKAFHKKFYLKTHEEQVHLKLNFFSCIICEKKFSFKTNLTTHMKNIHKT